MPTLFDPRTGLKVLLILCCALAAATAAADDSPLSLGQAQDLAVARDNGRGALVAEASAMRDRAVAAGELPDPEARIGATNVPVDSLALDREDMTMIEVGIMQRFTTRRSRELSRLQLEHHALHYDAEAELRRREVRLAVERSWRELDYLDSAIALLDEARNWTRVLIDGAAAAYESGAGSEAELLDARIGVLAIDEMLIERRRDRETADAELQRWIGMPAASREAAPDPRRGLATLAALEAKLESHPMLRGLKHETGAAQFEADLARERYKPAFGVDFGYGFRQGREMGGSGRSDMLSAMLTFDLPLFTRDRQDRELSAARSMLRATEARSDDARRVLASRLATVHSSATALEQSLELYESNMTPLVKSGVDASLAAYRAGDGSLAEVVAAQKRRLEAEQRRLRLHADLGVALAEIESLTGAGT
ncbi:MAG: TolC family protein [Steroidobacteraceae bacterium]